MADKSAAVALLKVLHDTDPESLDPPEMIAFLRDGIRAALHFLGETVADEDEPDPEFPTHAEQLARADASDYLGGDLTLRAGW